MPLSPQLRGGSRSSVCKRGSDVRVCEKDKGCALTANARSAAVGARSAVRMLSQITDVRIYMTNGLLSTERACPILALKACICWQESTARTIEIA